MYIRRVVSIYARTYFRYGVVALMYVLGLRNFSNFSRKNSAE